MPKPVSLRLVVPREASGARLDRFLAAALASTELSPSRAELQRWIERGKVSVDGAPKRAADKVREGAEVLVEPEGPRTTTALAEDGIVFDVLYVDADLVVVDKPPGLVVHPARGHESGTLVNGLLARGMFDVPLERIADDIIQALDRPFNLGDDLAYVSASIGITFFPQDATSPIDILKNADQAMYHAKDAGRNRFSYFSPAMQENALQRLQLGRDLRSALAEGQLELHFQPILHLASGEVRKAEALLRWNHPTRGQIPPDEFIPVAEELGLIDAIGSWVFERAIATIKHWRDLRPTPANEPCPLQITVNTSPRQFLRGRSLDVLMLRLEGAGLPGSCIAIEITEGLLLDEQPAVIAQLARLSAAGIQVSIDDFGTGYSAMAYLKRLDIDTLKIDRSFVRDLTTDPGDLAITEAIIAMAHKLDIKVVAEGVETLAQQERLSAAGCDYSQGFLFSRPLPAAAFFELIAQRP